MRGAVAVSLLLALAALPVRADEDHGPATTNWEPTALGKSEGHAVPLKPVDIKVALPPGMREPLLAAFTLGEQSYRLLIETVSDNPRLWFDQNRNRRLDDDPAIALQPGFKTKLALTVKHADEAVATTVEVAVALERVDGTTTLLIRPEAHRRGHAVLGGRLRHIALRDGNADLCFDDPTHDVLFVDLDGDGRLDTTSIYEQVRLGEGFRAGGIGYVASVGSRSGRAVTFRVVADAPPSPLRPWPSHRPPVAGTPIKPSANSFELLAKRFREQKQLPIAKRKLAVYHLGADGSRKAFDLLMKAARSDRDRQMRPVAFAALGNPAYLEYGGSKILAFAQKAPVELRRELPRILFRMAHPNRQTLCMELLRGDDAVVVGTAARHLAFEATPAGREAIFEAARTQPLPRARMAAYFGAAVLPNGPPADLMLFVVRDKENPAAMQALKDLHAIAHPQAAKHALAFANQRPVEKRVADTVIPILGAGADARSVAALLKMADAYAQPEALRQRLEASLSWIRDRKCTAAVINALDAVSAPIRILAADLLARGDDRRATSALIGRLAKEQDAGVRSFLMRALGDQRDPAAIDTLVRFAKGRGAMRSHAISALARMGFDNQRVRAFFLGLLDAPDWRDRLLALSAAGASGDKSLCKRMLVCLEHSQWQVRMALLAALHKLRCREAIEPLIERLESEDNGRVRSAIATTLYAITGMQLYDDVETWRRWWREHGKTFRVPETAPAAAAPVKSDTNPAFYGIPLVSNRIVFVIDQSGSMSVTGAGQRTRLDIAKKEVLRSIQRLDKTAKINVVLFNDGTRAWRDGLAFLSPSRRSNLERWLARRSPKGGTNLYDGLERALLTDGVDTVYLLSDGEPGAGRFVEASDIMREVRRINLMRGIAIHCVSIGRESPLLRQLAAEFDGQYVRR